MSYDVAACDRCGVIRFDPEFLDWDKVPKASRVALLDRGCNPADDCVAYCPVCKTEVVYHVIADLSDH